MVRRVAIVAGETSGDMLGAALIRAVRERNPDVEFYGIAGPKMMAEGAATLYPLEKLAVRGYVEVLKHFREIWGIRSQLTRRLLDDRPDLFIGVDAPDFNFWVETRLRAAGIHTVHYVSPSIWAWRPGRIHGIKRAVDRMLAVFPFEEAIYEKAGIPVSYVGHPAPPTRCRCIPTATARARSCACRRAGRRWRCCPAAAWASSRRTPT
jgi:lipid-A-disaccharide synthase